MARQQRKPVEEPFDIEKWTPKTILGKQVKAGEIKDIRQIIEHGKKITESEIVDVLLPDAEVDNINVGQAKGKFGGGKRRIVRQTQKKTAEGSKLHFAMLAVIGNKNGYVGIGTGKAMETMPARKKASRNAKLNIIEVARGCGSWECTCGEPHSLPFAMSGKSGSVRLTLLPAPKGTGLCVENDIKKVLRLAGYKDVWSKVKGQSRKKQNLIAACMQALKQGWEQRMIKEAKKGITYGATKK